MGWEGGWMAGGCCGSTEWGGFGWAVLHNAHRDQTSLPWHATKRQLGGCFHWRTRVLFPERESFPGLYFLSLLKPPAHTPPTYTHTYTPTPTDGLPHSTPSVQLAAPNCIQPPLPKSLTYILIFYFITNIISFQLFIYALIAPVTRLLCVEMRCVTQKVV